MGSQTVRPNRVTEHSSVPSIQEALALNSNICACARLTRLIPIFRWGTLGLEKKSTLQRETSLQTWNKLDYPHEFSNVCSDAQSHLILGDHMDSSLPGSSVHGIVQARILERVAISFSRRSSRPRNQTHIPCLLRCRRFFTTSATWEVHIF